VRSECGSFDLCSALQAVIWLVDSSFFNMKWYMLPNKSFTDMFQILVMQYRRHFIHIVIPSILRCVEVQDIYVTAYSAGTDDLCYSASEQDCSGSQKFVFRGDMENPWFVACWHTRWSVVAWVHVSQECQLCNTSLPQRCAECMTSGDYTCDLM
jgi:hypothetical protein